MGVKEKGKRNPDVTGISRRDFVTKASSLAVAGVAGTAFLLPDRGQAQEGKEKLVIPESRGYLLVDTKKCAGCGSCMLACSLVHEGQSNLSLSRIQIIDDAFGSYPTDIDIAMCRQCVEPACYLACPLKDKALYIDKKTGARAINEKECVGCMECINACYFTPPRICFNAEKDVAVKCDLCQNTPYWNSKGKQACVEVCPQNAIKFSATKPVGYKGYNVNLRGKGWAALGLPTN